ncbi:MAG: hypothetical protein JRN20_06600 [Nitrososphaerota archaeon]|nr:hypothetical protein [Nitrososphaerota archaeon]MDG6923383.1 hypothetical protein [Nitrososphaerota archaeon]
MFPRRRTVLVITVSLLAGMILTSGFFIFLSNSAQSDGTTEGLNVMGHVYLKAYHSDGSVFYSASGHNDISLVGANNLIACFTGLGQVANTLAPSLPGKDGTCSSFESGNGYPPNPFISGLWIDNAAYTEQGNIVYSGSPIGTLPPSLISQCGAACTGIGASVVLTQDLAGQHGCPSSASGGGCLGWNVTGVINPGQECSSLKIVYSCPSNMFPYEVQSAGAGYWSPLTQGLNGFEDTAIQFDAINLCASGCQAQPVTLNAGDSLQITIAFVVTT